MSGLKPCTWKLKQGAREQGILLRNSKERIRDPSSQQECLEKTVKHAETFEDQSVQEIVLGIGWKCMDWFQYSFIKHYRMADKFGWVSVLK